MPIYEYQCKHCGCKFEALQKHNDQPLTKCPECGKDALEKCVSLTSFQLKGKGWYETDFKSKKEPDKKVGEDKTAKKPESRDSSDQSTGSQQNGGESNKGNKTS
ncbi:MAG: zinc ribbon domain-containing protein [Gammaproteobacteria bacterium]|jgi:putative FmdB family regulatory protein